MKTTINLVFLLAALILTPAVQATEPTKSTARDRERVEVTVYNNNLGLIKETRPVVLPGGTGELEFMDVASHIQPSTVHVASPDSFPGFSILEQRYEYDLVSEQRLLDEYVGRRIKIVDWNRHHDRKEVVEATLLSNHQGQVYLIDGEIYLGHPGVKVLPEPPERLIVRPTLTWLFHNEKPGPRKLQVSYLTENINWSADYVLLLDASDSHGDLSGWVTLDNRSGAQYTDARLKLVAGAVQRVTPSHPLRRDVMLHAAAQPEADAFREESFFEYHLYDLERPTTIRDQQTTQIRLIETAGLDVDKELLVTAPPALFTRRYQDAHPRQPVHVYISFKNDEGNRPGMPLPAGIVRVYKEDTGGSQQFIGEDRIEHTPEGESVRIRVGEAFDVVSERTQKDYRQITSSLHESGWEISLRNRKKESVRIGVLERFSGNWEVLDHSHPYTRIDAFTIRFDVEVPAEQAVTVKYRIRVGI